MTARELYIQQLVVAAIEDHRSASGEFPVILGTPSRDASFALGWFAAWSRAGFVGQDVAADEFVAAFVKEIR